MAKKRKSKEDLKEEKRNMLAIQVLMKAYDKFAAENRIILRDKFNDQISVPDIFDKDDKPRDIEFLICRYVLRWCIELIADRGSVEVARQFSHIYMQICAQNASEEISENDMLREAISRLDEIVFPRTKGRKK